MTEQKPDYVGICIGSGAWTHPRWANLDYVSDAYADRQERVDYPCNLFNDNFPVADSLYQAAYLSHVVEHLSDRVVRHTLSETFRVLKPGGTVRIACPDFDKIADAYFRKDAVFFSRFGFVKFHPNESLHQRFLRCFAAGYLQKSKFEELPRMSDDDVQKLFPRRETAFEAAASLVAKIPESYNSFSPGTHMNVWTLQKMRSLLLDIGFTEAYGSWCQGSRSRHMGHKKHFDLTHPFMSLYVEARKG
ncbi:class I SAM-dependent methyltransferase [Parasedimentitalea huanghaiensis]|uniref:Methyltransferase domain-containing protein n=1 Tax=Parasedimentitalea huanghaiensis TaxID=2682100 RepID=A0A6L6WMH6_9RHOB|nr:methyltransferase domain-containing protein [Zongyanglinia huanghaiensis]MVO18520.1 methyltransferase domain-containing protein [Zongyanglinia huanghaiensis]